MPEPVNVWSCATVSVPLSHHGALGPEIMLLNFQVPEKSKFCAPADIGHSNKQMTQRTLNSLNKNLTGFAVRICDPFSAESFPGPCEGIA